MCVCAHACVRSYVQSVTPWTVSRQAPLSMRFSRQEDWSGLPFPPPGDLPDPGIEPTSPVSPALASGFFTTEPPGKPEGSHIFSLNSKKTNKQKKKNNYSLLKLILIS